jgi:hypothetical protein
VTFEGQPGPLSSALRQFGDVSLPARNVVLIRTNEQLVPRVIIEIGNAGVEIIDIDIRKPTLEDFFLQIARGNGRVD